MGILSRLKTILIAAAILLIVILVLALTFYKNAFEAEKHKRQRAEHQAAQYADALATMQEKQQQVAALDAKKTQELADAKNEISRLHDAVNAGAKRLHLHATCVPAGNAASTASLDDAATARLTADAEQHYFRLREQIATATTQITALQEYIREQCHTSKKEKETRQAR